MNNPAHTLILKPGPESHPYFVKYSCSCSNGKERTIIERFKKIGFRNEFVRMVIKDQKKELVSFGRGVGEILL